MKLNDKFSVNPKVWKGKTLAEFQKFCKGKVLSSKIKPKWDEMQSLIPKDKDVKIKKEGLK